MELWGKARQRRSPTLMTGYAALRTGIDMPDMREPYSYLEDEAWQMEAKADEARREILKLQAIADTCEQQARSLRWAIEQQQKADAERAA